ncbi:unnamed protein product, partial [Adineta steineri]
QVIVGLNNDQKKFMLGTIIDRVESGHRYLIKWCDETESYQEEEHLFGTFSTHNEHQINYYVLAVDGDQYIYKPARIKKILNDKRTLNIRFLDADQQNREVEVPSAATFVITEAYYKEIIKRLHE